MGDKSKIEWTDATWNPATGCTKVSPGCAHCYIENTFPFRTKNRRFDRKTGKTGLLLHPERLTQPLRWRRPRRIFVNSLSDLFHELMPDDFIDRVFAVMALAERHTFQILTKRPARMRDYLTELVGSAPLAEASAQSRIARSAERIARERGEDTKHPYWDLWLEQWPLKNVWLGVTAENQHFADERIPLLLQCPAAKRFVSYEPALGPVDVRRYIYRCGYATTEHFRCCDAFPHANPGIDWVICGGESGPKARPMDLVWARSARDQCKSAGVPFFMKQICDARGRAIPFDQWPQDLKAREFPVDDSRAQR